MSNPPLVETAPPPPPPDFDENVHIWSKWSEKKNCQIKAYLVGNVLFEIWALKVLQKRLKWGGPHNKKPATTPKI